ncbi:MAG: hypothetical protein ABEK36_01230 [Candidatus Aenigmatarchaeota archaeon]
MYFPAFWLLLAIASVLIIGGALGNTKTSLYLFIPAGAMFLLMGGIVYDTGINIQNGSEVTVYNETKTTNDILRVENKTIERTNIFNGRDDFENWFAFLNILIGMILILIGATWRFV